MERARAISADVERFEAAREERDRRAGQYTTASGSPDELSAFVELQAAEEQLAARDAWLRWVDDDGYRGLNAGPFELLAEDSGP